MSGARETQIPLASSWSVGEGDGETDDMVSNHVRANGAAGSAGATPSVDTGWFQARLADKKLSQRGLARLLALDPSAVSLMLRGKRKMTAAEAAEIARFLGVSVEEVLTRAGSVATIPKGRSDGASFGAGPVGAGSSAAVDVGANPPDGETLEVPVPLASGGMARLILPRRLGRADADRIAALLAAFVVES